MGRGDPSAPVRRTVHLMGEIARLSIFPLAGALLFRERLTRAQTAGAALITVGVVLVGASGL